MTLKLKDGDYGLAEGGLWLGVKNFSIRVVQTDEGVVVDIYALGCENDSPLSGTYAFDQEAKDTIAESMREKNGHPF